ncbi:hypothetical protein PhaeoP23_03697 (plasmid) [Phaeobacter piscinae]|uniref:Nucleotidyl transferase AbiEii/AbiGii toxin family protein n=1 Tax=Phaeobacter piscinae TaxID=1580596 RepID=A0ABM7DMZ1_9RHOB|nr:nucleotidyl transferase AbiEii/AbiGii toxin family protein [Phaeobacter piscinae]ATG37774.1 hypothetical protein PhaeoP36_03697 [Phaeobacter piscinae]AUQ88295.1 hypothetical protein PhaeoP42_03698 [Phaeobacter piscinae]AUR26178.1 hypothetical protein PhaeoP23_03697 [Phaeobacter piscinae]
MSDTPEKANHITVNIASWVERAKADPVAYLERQATELFLATLAMTKPYCQQVFLKGGILMGVVYGSPRQTGDIDFTTTLDPQPGIAEELAEALNKNFPRASAELGYPDLMCQVQSCKYFPKGEAFPKNDGPAVTLSVGYAMRGSKQEKHLRALRSPTRLKIDISFKEPVGAIQVVHTEACEDGFGAYSLCDLMAEKLRALLQQEKRDRYRRQDFYDLDVLIQGFPLDAEERQRLLERLYEKCRARDIEPGANGLSNPEIIRRAREGWRSNALEITGLPDFDECHKRVNDFYQSLPW